MKNENMKDLFFYFLKDIYDLKINDKIYFPLSLINNLKNKNKYYVTNKKYALPLSYGNDEAIYHE